MKDIKILVLDVDGTLTDGKIYVDDKDNSFKAFNVKDGFALVNWLKLGGEVAILTGKKSNIVERDILFVPEGTTIFFKLFAPLKLNLEPSEFI